MEWYTDGGRSMCRIGTPAVCDVVVLVLDRPEPRGYGSEGSGWKSQSVLA